MYISDVENIVQRKPYSRGNRMRSKESHPVRQDYRIGVEKPNAAPVYPQEKGETSSLSFSLAKNVQCAAHDMNNTASSLLCTFNKACQTKTQPTFPSLHWLLFATLSSRAPLPSCASRSCISCAALRSGANCGAAL